MITANIVTSRHKVKTAHYIDSLSSIRLIIPKGWDAEYVNIVLWEEGIAELKITDPETFEFTIPKCGEILLKKVIKDEQRHYVYLPERYDGQQVLIVPA